MSTIYNKINIQQGSPEWLAWRKTKVTATDAAIIMGLNPFKTPYKLWQQKLGLIPPDKITDKMLEGQELEPEARKFYSFISCTIEPLVVINNDFPWQAASLDGITIEEGREEFLVEIKCGKHAYEVAPEVPSYYYTQIQHQLAVTGLHYCDYFCYRNDKEFHNVIVKRDEAFIKKMLIAEEQFYQSLVHFEPPEMKKSDFYQKIDEDWLAVAYQYKDVCTQLENLESAKELLKKRLVAMSDGINCIGGGLAVRKVVRKGNIAYAEIPELADVNLDKYRKPAIESWRIDQKVME